MRKRPEAARKRRKAALSGLKSGGERGEWRERVCVCVGGSRAAVGSHATYFREYRGLRRITVSMPRIDTSLQIQ